MGDDSHPRLLCQLEIGCHEEWLHREHRVWAIEALAGLEKTAQWRRGEAQEPLLGADIEQTLPQRPEAPRALVEGHSVTTDAPLHARRPVVAQVLADARQVVADLDAEPLEALALADAGKLQKLRRGDGPSRDNHLAGGPCLAL